MVGERGVDGREELSVWGLPPDRWRFQQVCYAAERVEFCINKDNEEKPVQAFVHVHIHTHTDIYIYKELINQQAVPNHAKNQSSRRFWASSLRPKRRTAFGWRLGGGFGVPPGCTARLPSATRRGNDPTMTCRSWGDYGVETCQIKYYDSELVWISIL